MRMKYHELPKNILLFLLIDVLKRDIMEGWRDW